MSNGSSDTRVTRNEFFTFQMLVWMYFTVVLGELVSRDPSNWQTWFLEAIALLMAIFCAVMMFRSRASWRPAAEDRNRSGM